MPGDPSAFLDRLDPRERDAIRRIVARGVNSPHASSAGRLFDAVASLLGLCDDAGYEGEAAVLLEAAAEAAPDGTPALPWRLTEAGGLWVYDWSGTLGAILDRHAAGEPVPVLAAAFHRTIVQVTAALCARALQPSLADGREASAVVPDSDPIAHGPRQEAQCLARRKR